MVYQSDFNDEPIEEIAESTISEFDMTVNSDEEAGGIVEKAKAILDNAGNADEIIARYSKTRKVERIAKVSAAIMRAALYEMDCDEDVPDKVAINEAIELCKKYAEKPDCNFVSGVLGSYYREKNGIESVNG